MGENQSLGSASPLDKITALARRYGFAGETGNSLLEFLESHLWGDQENARVLAAVEKSLAQINGASWTPCPSASLPAVVTRLATEAAVRISAQSATIKMLVDERQRETPARQL